jgi:hypothetical protein
MAREDRSGHCEHCGENFRWHLIHNGFNSACHAYCSSCGATALLSLLGPALIKRNIYPGGITPDLERSMRACTCGGSFLANAAPRCPSCRAELSAMEASKYIEPAEPGPRNGWHWQRRWTGPTALYAIIINGREVENPFLAP